MMMTQERTYQQQYIVFGRVTGFVYGIVKGEYMWNMKWDCDPSCQVVQAFAMGMADVEHSTPFTFNTFCRMYCVAWQASTGNMSDVQKIGVEV